MKLPRFTLRELFLLVVIAAMGCGWWGSWQRAAREQRQLASEVAALHRARALDLEMWKHTGHSVPYVPAETRQTSEEFIVGLREIKDWYMFAKTADSFAKSQAAGQAIPALIDLLADSDKETRTRAASALGKIGLQPERVVPALIPVLEDREPNVQWHAVLALSHFGTNAKPALEALVQLLEVGIPGVAIQSAHAIEDIDPSIDTEPKVLQFLESEQARDRIRVSVFLHKYGTTVSRPALLAAFERETDTQVKDSLARTIAAISERTADQEDKD